MQRYIKFEADHHLSSNYSTLIFLLVLGQFQKKILSETLQILTTVYTYITKMQIAHFDFMLTFDELVVPTDGKILYFTLKGQLMCLTLLISVSFTHSPGGLYAELQFSVIQGTNSANTANL